MNQLTGFLDHLLKSAGATVTGANQTNRGSGIGGAINSDFGRGTLTGGALGLLMGKNKKMRKLAQYGGLAALGMMVYNTYGEYQRQQAGTAGGAQPAGAPAQPAPQLPAPQTVDRLPAAQADAHGAAILQAIVAAAKADGHIDARERELIEGEYARQGLPADVQQWLHAELEKPLDPAQVARAATSPELAAEMYLASLLVADEQSFMERAYLDELARQLKLPADLQARLQRQLVQASQAA
ncbi:MAG: tellurite resistance TerB family protein [Pseudomonadota bacterium]|nr:tellurite resistance TerB family protein [Pseudomonadota bacterium]